MKENDINNSDAYVLGAGGQARQAAAIFSAIYPDLYVSAFLDNDPKNVGSKVNKIPVMDESVLHSLDPKDFFVVNGLGRPSRRRAIQKLIADGCRFLELKHPLSTIGPFVEIWDGTIVQAGVLITTNVKIGKFVLLDLGVTVGHDVNIDDFTTVAPGSNISGNVTIGSGTWIGAGTVIIEGVSVGDNTIVGAGSVVTKNLPSNTLAYGSPAKKIKEIEDVSEYLKRHDR